MIKEIILGGGCFWGVQKYFDQIKGITKTEVGYANGPRNNATYEEVCNSSGHAEVIYVHYDDAKITLNDLIYLYMRIVDPTTINMQGNDVGVQYRTGIYTTNKEDLEVVKKLMNDYQSQYTCKIRVEIKLLKNYIPAENYHQKYLVKNPNGYCHISHIDIPKEYLK